jgi:hypothetical protein
MEKKTLFSKAIANKIALKSFGLVLDCLIGYSDSGYGLPSDGSEFEQNFEEDLEEMGITPTSKRIEQCRIAFNRLANQFEAMVRKKYYK